MANHLFPSDLDARFGPGRIEPFVGVREIGANKVVMRSGLEGFPQELRIAGEGARIVIEKDCDLSAFRIFVRGRRQRVHIGKGCSLRGSLAIAGSSGTGVVIGAGSAFAGVEIYCAEGAGVSIGQRCMFSKNIEIRTSDAHGVYDATTRRRVNPARPVSIGDHVWISLGAVINKGARIPNDCIVGANAFVNKEFAEERVVIAGAPARIVKRNVLWDAGRAEQLPEDRGEPEPGA